LPANINLVGAENELVSVVGRETILREAIAPVEEKFDYLIIDCPPSLGLLTLNALAAVEEILIPLQPHFLALQGFGKLLQTVELVNRRINPILKVKGILLCMFDSRASLPKEVKADIERFLDKARGTNCAWLSAQRGQGGYRAVPGQGPRDQLCVGSGPNLTCLYPKKYQACRSPKLRQDNLRV
jgi:chromosome partitioning protein